jgi:predicted O-linked N-acetylglucosamine transferase (SPINDLY family)
LPAIPNLPKSRSYFGLAENIPLYLCSQLNLKYLPQHDRLLAQIARQIPQAQFIFIRRASQELTERLLQRLQRTFADFGLDALQYCVVLPPLSRIDYLHLNRCVTVFLDTLLWSGGNTTFDALACGLPVVTSPGPWMRSRQSYGMLQQLGVTETIAQDEDEYVAIAVRLAQDPQWRQELHTRLLANQRNLFGDQSGVQALEQLYLLLGRRFAE